MNQNAISAAKGEIESLLRVYLQPSQIIADSPAGKTCTPLVSIDGIQDMPLHGSLLQWEIRILLGMFREPMQCEKLVEKIYGALSQYRPTAAELNLLFTSLHVEAERVTIRYVLDGAD